MSGPAVRSPGNSPCWCCSRSSRFLPDLCARWCAGPRPGHGPLAVQNGFLALGPLVGSLGAMAMIWLRNRVRPAKAMLVLAATLWMMGATLVGFGVFTAFVPGDRSVLTNLGYSVALCLTPGARPVAAGTGNLLVQSAAEQRRRREPGKRDRRRRRRARTAVPRPDYDDLRRRAAEYRGRIREFNPREEPGPLR